MLLICFCISLFLLCGVAKATASNVWDGSVVGSFAGGAGTADNSYLIENGAQLAHIGSMGYYKLTEDIYLNNTESWESWTEENGPVKT